MDVEIAVALPFPVALGADTHVQLSATILLYHGMPLFDVEIGAGALGVYRAAPRAVHLHVDGCHAVVCHREIERCDAHWDGHLHIVGVDDGQLVHHLCVFRTGGTGSEQADTQQQTKGKTRLAYSHGFHGVFDRWGVVQFSRDDQREVSMYVPICGSPCSSRQF